MRFDDFEGFKELMEFYLNILIETYHFAIWIQHGTSENHSKSFPIQKKNNNNKKP